METIIQFILGIGKWLFRFTKTTAGKVVKEYGDDIEKIIIEAAQQGGTGEEKMQYAIMKLSLLAPGIAVFVARAAIETVYSVYKEKQMTKDTDGDGVPDYLDVCKEIGAPEGGCVTVDGCPDSDCDGIADSEDKCPNDPDCQ